MPQQIDSGKLECLSTSGLQGLGVFELDLGNY